MRNLKFYLFNFLLKKKIFFLIQLIILITLTFSLAIPNFKETVSYELFYKSDFKWQKIQNKSNYIRFEYNRIVERMGAIERYVHYDFFENYSLKNLEKFAKFKDPSDFLDLGYSEARNVFYVKRSKIDFEREKIEILKANNNFKIKDYQVKYNHNASKFYIKRLKEFERIVRDLKQYLDNVDRSYLFEKALNEYQLKIDFTKQIFGETKRYFYIPYPDELNSSCHKKVLLSNPNDLNNLYKYIKCITNKNIMDIYPSRIIDKFQYIEDRLSLESAFPIIDIKKMRREKFLSHYFDYIRDNIYFMDIEKLKKWTDTAVANNIILSNESIDKILDSIYEQMRFVKEFNYIDFKLINSEYLLKYKIIETIKYFLLVSFMLIIFNIIYYFYFFKKNN